MGKIRHCLLVVLTLAALVVCPTVAWGDEAISIQTNLSSDKDSYIAGDVAELKLSITNVSSEAVGAVAYEFQLPNNMKPVDGVSPTGLVGDMRSGDQRDVAIKVDMFGDDYAPIVLTTSDNDNRLASTGDNNAAAVLALLIVIAAIIALLASRRSRNTTLSILLICGLSGILSVSSMSEVHAVEPPQTVSATQDVSLDGKNLTMTALVTYAKSSDSPDTPLGILTRGEWIHLLLQGTQTEFQTEIECPYVDIGGHDYESAIKSAYSLGIIPDELTEFKPDAPAAREFVFASAVLLSGFVDDGTVLSALDESEASHPSLLAIALDVGIASLDDQGYIYPTKNFESDQVQVVIQKVVQLLAFGDFEDEGIEVNYRDDVVVVDDYDAVNGGFVVDADQYDIAIGDKVAFVPSESWPEGAAGAVVSVIEKGEGLNLVAYEQATSPDEIFESIRVVDYDQVIDPSAIELAEGVTFNETPQVLSRASVTVDPIELSIEKPFSGGNLTASVVLKPSLDVSFDWSLLSGVKKLDVAIYGDIEASAKVSLKDFDKTIQLNKTPIVVPLVGGACVFVNLNLHISADGEANLSASIDQTVGVRYQKGHLKLYENGDSSAEANLEASMGVGVAPVAILTFCGIELCDLAVELGAKAKGSLDVRDTGLRCVDASAYGYAEASCGENTFWMESVGLKIKQDLVTEKNSPFKWKAHLEDGKTVPKCTYKQQEPEVPDTPDIPTPDVPNYSEGYIPEIKDNGYGVEPSFIDRGVMMGPILSEPFNIYAGNTITLGGLGAYAPLLSFWMMGDWECTPGTVFLMKFYDSNGVLQSEEVKTSADTWHTTGTRYPNEPLTIEVLYGRVTVTNIAGYFAIPYSFDTVPSADYPMQISATRLDMSVGATDQLITFVHESMQGYSWSGDTTWESSDPEIAAVNNEGVVTAVSSGVATVTVSWGKTYSRQCAVVVR